MSAFITHVEPDTEPGPKRFSLASLDAAALTLLAEGLQKLDQPLDPISRIVRGSATASLRFCEKELSKSGTDGFDLDAGMRFGFSAKWMLADAIERELAIAEALDRTDQTWAELRVLANEYKKGLTKSEPNKLWLIWATGISNIEITRRTGRTRLIALRMAVARARGAELEFSDPFASPPIRVKDDGKTTRYWSVGPDGDDNGGDPKLDVVFEVTR